MVKENFFELGVKFKLVECFRWLIRRRFGSVNCVIREFLKLFLRLFWSFVKGRDVESICMCDI